MRTQLKLEQQILDCWNVTKDIDTIHEAFVELELTPDQVSNVLLGISELYNLKFDQLFRTFEKYIKEQHLYRNKNDIQSI